MKFTDNIIPTDEQKTLGALRFVTSNAIMGYDETAGASTGIVEEVRVELSSAVQRGNFIAKLPADMDKVVEQLKRGDMVALKGLVIKNYAVIEADAFGNQANEGFSVSAKAIEKVSAASAQTNNQQNDKKANTPS